MKIRLFIKYQYKNKFYVDGEISEEEYLELNSCSCSSITLNKVTVKLYEIWGWEVII